MTKRLNPEPDAEHEIAHIPTDDRYRVLSDARRRLVLEVLVDWRAPIGVDDLAAEVASREEHVEADDRVKISLHHAHLPMLDDVGVIDYDHDRNRVRSSQVALEELTA